MNEHGELIDDDAAKGNRDPRAQEAENFKIAILENLKKAGVQQSDKGNAIQFESLREGSIGSAPKVYMEGETERRAGIFIIRNTALSNAPTLSPVPARPQMQGLIS